MKRQVGFVIIVLTTLLTACAATNTKTAPTVPAVAVTLAAENNSAQPTPATKPELPSDMMTQLTGSGDLLTVDSRGITRWSENGATPVVESYSSGCSYGSPEISPVGELLLYTKQCGANMQLVVSTNEGSESALVTVAGNIAHPRWSPDGRKIVFSMNHTNTDDSSVYLFDSVSREQKLLASDAATPDWSPDGTEIVFVADRHVADENHPYLGLWYTDLVIYELATGETRSIMHDYDYHLAPSWSSDGKSIVFTANSGNGWKTSSIEVFDLSTGQTRTIANMSGGCMGTNWSPDSKWITFTCFGVSGAAGGNRLYAVLTDNSTSPVDIRDNISAASWSR